MRVFLICLLAVVLSACAAPPRSLQDAPASSPAPERVKENPGAFEGRRVVWGGEIVAVTNESEVTRVSVLAKPLDGRRRPEVDADGGARFMALFDGFRDPLVYRKGRQITVIGRVEGTRQAPVGDYNYNHPVVAVTSHELWEEPDERLARPDRYYYDPFIYDPFFFRSRFHRPRYHW